MKRWFAPLVVVLFILAIVITNIYYLATTNDEKIIKDFESTTGKQVIRIGGE